MMRQYYTNYQLINSATIIIHYIYFISELIDVTIWGPQLEQMLPIW
jgi:hypothetical protein